jgi:signal transduction histidine kinase
MLSAVVEDDGVGGAAMTPGGGLAGLVDRLGALGGRVDLRSPAGGGTQVRLQVPVA